MQKYLVTVTKLLFLKGNLLQFLLHFRSNLFKVTFCKYENNNIKMLIRLRVCNLPTLHYRRIKGDMIETYKILSGKYDMVAVPNLITSTILTTRGNYLRLQKTRTRYDLRKFFFTKSCQFMEQLA